MLYLNLLYYNYIYYLHDFSEICYRIDNMNDAAVFRFPASELPFGRPKSFILFFFTFFLRFDVELPIGFRQVWVNIYFSLWRFCVLRNFS